MFRSLAGRRVLPEIIRVPSLVRERTLRSNPKHLLRLRKTKRSLSMMKPPMRILSMRMTKKEEKMSKKAERMSRRNFLMIEIHRKAMKKNQKRSNLK